MSTIAWIDELKIGITEIDRQHQEFICRTNAFMLACEDQKGPLEVVAQLDYLGQYARQHFQDEERMLLQNRYPSLEEHRGKHAEFARELDRLRRMILAAGPTSDVVTKTRNLTVEWLLQHITVEDMKYARLLTSKEAS